MEEQFQVVQMEQLDDAIKPYLRGIEKIEGGYQALCIRANEFKDNAAYQFKRASIEDIMVYLEK